VSEQVAYLQDRLALAYVRIKELEKEFGKGKWVWGEVFDHDKSVADYPENPQPLIYTKVWLPDAELEL